MIITIARQSGCSGKQVGQLLAEHYHIPLYDKDALIDMAQKTGLYGKHSEFLQRNTGQQPAVFDRRRLWRIRCITGSGSCAAKSDWRARLRCHWTLQQLRFPESTGQRSYFSLRRSRCPCSKLGKLEEYFQAEGGTSACGHR